MIDSILLRKLHSYAVLMRLDRPIGTLLLLWPTLWALWIAGKGSPDLLIVIIFITGTLLTRSAGCVINDFADRHYDGHVERTKQRPLVTNAVSAKEALLLYCLLMLGALFLVLLLNILTVMLAVIGAAIAAVYPLMKRFLPVPQLVLSLAFAWGVPMAFAAQSDELPLIAWLLFSAVMCWIMAYDTIYAMVDRSDDIRIGINSAAIFFGNYDRFMIGTFQLTTLILLFIAGFSAGLHSSYYALVLLAATCFIYQQYLLASGLSAAYFRAFLNNNWFGLLVFVAVFAGQ